jgi:hypothetical protein
MPEKRRISIAEFVRTLRVEEKKRLPVFDGWFDMWHTHVDWEGDGSTSRIYRQAQLRTLSIAIPIGFARWRAVILSGNSSRSRDTFFCFAKRKYPKKRRPGIRALRLRLRVSLRHALR